MSGHARWIAASAAIIVLALLGAGCGIGGQAEPQEVPADRVPYGLLDPAEATVPQPAGKLEPVALYFVKGDRLKPVFREVPVDSTPEQILAVLVRGPSAAEQDDGLSVAVTDAQPIRSVTTRRGAAIVDLGPSSDVQSDEQALAVAEIVFTLTARPGIGRVSFTLEGEAIEVPDGTGALTGEPLAREDFEALAPPGG